MFGIWTGAFFHALLAAAGLSAVLAASAIAFGIVKWVGVIYLVWLGFQALMSNESFTVSSEGATRNEDASVFKQGVLISLLNPKVAIFFLAFLPQFVVEGAGPVSAQLFLHGILVIVAAGIVDPPLVLAGARFTEILRSKKQIGVWLDRALGSLFIALGIRLAFTERN